MNLGSSTVTLIAPHTDKSIVTAKSIEAKRELLRIHLEHLLWLVTHGHSADGAGRLYAAYSTADGVEVCEIADPEKAAESIGVARPVIKMTLRELS